MSDVNGKPGKTTGLFLLHLHVCFITEFLLPIVLDSMHLKQLTFFPSRSSRKSNRTHKQIWIVIFIIHTSSCSFWARLFLGVSWSRGTPKPLVSPLNMTNWIIFSAPPLFENMLPRARELIVFFLSFINGYCHVPHYRNIASIGGIPHFQLHPNIYIYIQYIYILLFVFVCDILFQLYPIIHIQR